MTGWSWDGDVGAESRARHGAGEPVAQEDGRAAQGRDADRAQASSQESSEASSVGEMPAMEVSTGTERLVVWNVSADEAGHRVEASEAEDESTVQAEMAEQGRDDADQDLRRAARAKTN